MLHYVEKPQSYISPIINCGVYLFSLSIFESLAKVFNEKQRDFYNNGSLENIEAKEAMWLEKDILMPMAGKKCQNHYSRAQNNRKVQKRYDIASHSHSRSIYNF